MLKSFQQNGHIPTRAWKLMDKYLYKCIATRDYEGVDVILMKCNRLHILQLGGYTVHVCGLNTHINYIDQKC